MRMLSPGNNVVVDFYALVYVVRPVLQAVVARVCISVTGHVQCVVQEFDEEVICEPQVLADWSRYKGIRYVCVEICLLVNWRRYVMTKSSVEECNGRVGKLTWHWTDVVYFNVRVFTFIDCCEEFLHSGHWLLPRLVQIGGCIPELWTIKIHTFKEYVILFCQTLIILQVLQL